MLGAAALVSHQATELHLRTAQLVAGGQLPVRVRPPPHRANRRGPVLPAGLGGPGAYPVEKRGSAPGAVGGVRQFVDSAEPIRQRR